MIDDMPGNRAFDGDFPAFSIHAIIEKSEFTVFGIRLILFRRHFDIFRIRRYRHFADFFTEIVRCPLVYSQNSINSAGFRGKRGWIFIRESCEVRICSINTVAEYGRLSFLA